MRITFTPVWMIIALLLAAPFAGTVATAEPTEEEQLAKLKTEATEAYTELETAFMAGEWDGLDTKIKTMSPRQKLMLEKEAKENLVYMQKALPGYRPSWWSNVSSSSNVSFGAEIWGRKFIANYRPSESLGEQAVIPEGRWVRTRDGYEGVITKLNIIVSWKPSLVDNPKPAQGKLAETQGTKYGDIAETIIWHELGHNYITTNLPLNQTVELYKSHTMLFQHLQEFYADLTSIYHSAPYSQRVQLMIRLDGLDYYDEEGPHTRASHAVGSLLLADMLANPEKWPSVHFPPSVPKKQVELNTIIYVYEHWDPKWSLDEHRRLRDQVDAFIKRYGEATLRSRGVAQLPNDQKFALMVAKDRENQEARDKWVTEKLEGVIKDGRADKLAEGKKYDPRNRDKRAGFQGIRVIIRDGKQVNDNEAPRIELPF